jgi:hypothetical protein
MIWRHKEFVLRYNAECDAAVPKSLGQIVAELEADERHRAARAAATPRPRLPAPTDLAAHDASYRTRSLRS